MHEREGVIKYDLVHSYAAIVDITPARDINAWRTIFFRLGLIGRDPNRYEGLGFGNISVRIDDTDGRFLITGTQTGHLSELHREHFCMVDSIDFTGNRIHSHGESKPSSEALTHACIYQKVKSVGAVIHVHSPEIWHNARTLELPCTDRSISYGSKEMAAAVEKLFDSEQCGVPGAFAMLGHVDGVVAVGPSLEQAAWTLVKLLTWAVRIEQRPDKA
ncbi:MAG: class II aldolase/adducin family protein [Gammaproteobacteria bacterium]